MASNRKNYIVYFYVYFVIQVIFIYINVFLPVYFFRILKIDRTELALIQLLSYLALFTKPIIAIYIDKKFSNKRLKNIIIISSIGLVFSFVLFIFNLNTLVIFGIFFGINIVCISLLDVTIDKIIVSSSLDDKTKDKSALFTQIGNILGAITPNLFFLILFTDIYSIPTWNQFFLIGIFCIVPVISIGFVLKTLLDGKTEKEIFSEEDLDIKSIILMCMILFLFYGERIYEYPLEPWILNKYGEEYFSVFVLLLILLIIINALGLFLGGSISSKLDRKKLLILSSMGYGILLIIVPFTNIIAFFILFAIMQIFSGIIIINLISLMIKYSQKRVAYFQIMTTFAILALVIFIPLGTFLSTIISTELIIVLAGVLKLLSIIPICLLNIKKKDIGDIE